MTKAKFIVFNCDIHLRDRFVELFPRKQQLCLCEMSPSVVRLLHERFGQERVRTRVVYRFIAAFEPQSPLDERRCQTDLRPREFWVELVSTLVVAEGFGQLGEAVRRRSLHREIDRVGIARPLAGRAPSFSPEQFEPE